MTDRLPLTLADAFDAFLLPTMVVDTDLRVTMVNTAAEQVIGHSRDDALGCTLAELMGSDARVAATFDLNPINVGGELRGFVAVGRPGDDPVNPVGELRHQFLRAVSHELRTPLTAVVGYSETLRLHGASIDESRTADILTRLSRNAVRLRSLLDDLLDVDRLSRGVVMLDARLVDLSEPVLAAVEHAVSPSAQVRVRAEHVIAQADPPKVERIVENLLSNAIKHAGRSATVWVTLDHVDDHALIVVEDDGVGIPESDRARAFLPFEQGLASRRDANPGPGVGLNLARELTRLHGGEVVMTERDGGGLRVEVLLPISVGEPLQSVAGARGHDQNAEARVDRRDDVSPDARP